MSKPSEKAIAAASKWANETITLGDLAVEIATKSLALVIDTHVAEALTEHQRVIDMADGALGSLLGHLEANFNDNVSCWYKQGVAAKAEIAKLRKE